MSETPAGWYPDPDSPDIARWWDGAAWTDARRAAPSGPQEVVARGTNQGFVIFLVMLVAVVAIGALAHYYG